LESETTILSHYWNICRISFTKDRVGYETRLVIHAKEFFHQYFDSIASELKVEFLEQQNKQIQTALLAYFHDDRAATDPVSRAEAGLCLRCYVSYPILKACQKIANLCGQAQNLTYRDLLPYVLNDDGKALIILDGDRKTQLVVDDKGSTQLMAYKVFAVEILRTFQPDAPTSMSLDNWVYFKTKQNSELKNFLSENGFKHLSDWALLNRASSKQLQQLLDCDRHLVAVFHAVYRRDRRQQGQLGVKRCPDPSQAQLQEMLTQIPAGNSIVKTTTELMTALKQVAMQLRQYDIWSYRQPLEIHDPETNNYILRADLPTNTVSELDLEEREFLDFLHQQLHLALAEAIEIEIGDRITNLKKSRKYAPFASQFIQGLKMYYERGLSLKEIAPCLKMTSWDQARRILNPGELLDLVRERTVKQVFDRTLTKAQEKGLTQLPPTPDYIKILVEQIEAFADREIFQQAAEEIRVGKNRSMNSVYAEQLRLYISVEANILKYA